MHEEERKAAVKSAEAAKEAVHVAKEVRSREERGWGRDGGGGRGLQATMCTEKCVLYV